MVETGIFVVAAVGSRVGGLTGGRVVGIGTVVEIAVGVGVSGGGFTGG